MPPLELRRRILAARPIAAQRRLPGFEQKIGDAVHRRYDDRDIRRRAPHVGKSNANRFGVADRDATKLEHLRTRLLHEEPEYRGALP